MSQENVELVRRLLSAFDSADYEAALEALPWDTHRFVPEEMLDHGEHVVVGGMQIGRGRGSGVEVRLSTFHVFTMREGKVTRHLSYRDRSEALQAAGLRE
jgi:ketosteroid isomerase-like protein